MSYQVIARKWRPQNFNEVVFQDHVSRTLSNSIANSRISHAYLFSGPRGVGKTTMARILARALNCSEGPTVNPCGNCDNCREIRHGTSFDVIEIDGASNRGIEDIRELRENVNFAPVRARYKIYIIDEVHMLTKEAFNALLKTLEEPPSHVIFIFATTEIHQIPETILSRCQKFFFKKIPIQSIVGHLERIVEAEGYKVSGRALYPIARAAEGSMRDAQSLLDQVIAFSDTDSESMIREEDALSILGVVPLESYIRQMVNISKCQKLSAIEEIDRVITMGVDIPRYIAGFVDSLRALRLIRNGIALQGLLGLSDQEIKSLEECASAFEDEDLALITDSAIKLHQSLRYSFNERISLEMAVLDMINIAHSPSLSNIIKRLDESGLDTEDGMSACQKKKTEFKELKKSEKIETTPSEREFHKDGFIDFLHESRPYLSFILQPASMELRADTCIVDYPAGMGDSYYRKLLEGDNKKIVTEQLAGFLGRKLDLVIRSNPDSETGDRQNEPALTENQGREVKVDDLYDEKEEAPLPEAEMIKNPELEENSLTNPAVEIIKETFHGEVIEKE